MKYFVLDTSILDTIPAHEVRGSERDSSGTTEGRETPEGDGADSPTRAPNGREAARPISNEKLRIIIFFRRQLNKS